MSEIKIECPSCQQPIAFPAPKPSGFWKLTTLVFGLALVCVIYLAERTPKYDYSTFTWPAGTEYGRCSFYKENSDVGNWEDHNSLALILWMAQTRVGAEYVGSVGDTIIMRSIDTKHISGGYTGQFSVLPEKPQ